MMHHMDTREATARVAGRVIAERGIDGASLREVASRMDLTTGALTHRFRDRSDLLAATFEVTVDAIRERATRAAGRHDGVERIVAMLAEGLPLDATRRTESAVWLAFAESAIRDDADAARYRAAYDDGEASLRDVLVELGLVPADRAGTAARLLLAITDGIALRALAGGLPAREQHALLHTAVRGILEGGS